MAGLGPQGPEFEPLSPVELILGGVDSACHSSEVGKMSTSVLVIGALHQRHTRGPQIVMLPAALCPEYEEQEVVK